jgi:pimeloyl-ACP methyl ester carboxylesterase
MLIDTSAGSVSVRTTGSGPPIVLLHANGSDHHDFDAVAPTLAGSWTVHELDWPGHGDSGPALDAGACVFAAALPTVLDALGGGPFVLLGNSVGGFAAIRTAARRPDLVAALVLVDPGGFTRHWAGTTLACRALGSRAMAPHAMRWLPRLSLRRHTEWTAAAVERAVVAAGDPDRVAVFAAMWRSFAVPCHDATVDAPEVHAPALVVWGTRDPVLPWRTDGRRAMRSLPGARSVTLRCGHQAHLEMPEPFLNAVERFLRPTHDRLATG